MAAMENKAAHLGQVGRVVLELTAFVGDMDSGEKFLEEFGDIHK